MRGGENELQDMKRMDSKAESVNETVKEFSLTEYKNSLKQSNLENSHF